MLNQFKAIDQLFDQINNVFYEADELADILQTVTEQIQTYLHIDRVKVYRFAPEGHGQVVAEARNPEQLPSLLGLHFPASDIPPQARQLFLKARQRVIVNVAAKQKALVPPGIAELPTTRPDFDLRYGPVDDCHLEYLASMGVMASLTVPLFDQGDLWGLIAIHHSRPYSFSEQQLQLVQLWANLISVALAKAKLMIQANWQDHYLELQRRLNQALGKPMPLLNNAWEQVLQAAVEVMQVDGARLYLANCLVDEPSAIYTWGQQPAWADLEERPIWVETVQWLQAEYPLKQDSDITNALKGYGVSDLHHARDMAPVCGLVDDTSPLAAAFAGTGLKNILIAPIRYQDRVLGYLSLFRFPQLIERTWAGKYDGDKRLQKPRESFEAWVEQYQTIRSWQPEVVQMAQEVAIRLYAVLVQQGARKLVTQKSAYDSVTHLPVDKLLLHSLSLKLFQTNQEGADLALGILGLDRFKVVNESMGHSVGDDLLWQVAERLRNQLTRGVSTVSTPVLGRWHGDGFVVALPYISSSSDIGRYSQDLLSIFKTPFKLQDQEVYTTASIGWAVAPYSGESLDLLLQHAEIAMHNAKRSGRHTFKLYDPAQSQNGVTDVVISSALHSAILQQELTLYYQPQLNLATGDVAAVEALLRWHHPKLGLMSPGRFIPLAEETGLIVPIGEWVIRQACHQHRLWIEQGLPPMRIAINLSLTQFQDPNLVQTIRQILQEEGVDPRWIELEITEEATTQDLQNTVKQLRTLTQYGFTIALDDFGKGYSSLNVLKHFPLHTLKIDRAFIRDLETDASSLAIAKTIVALGEGLNLNTVAEGVENENQLTLLQTIGCHQVQGYWFSRPMAPGAMGQWLRNRSSQKCGQQQSSALQPQSASALKPAQVPICQAPERKLGPALNPASQPVLAPLAKPDSALPLTVPRSGGLGYPASDGHSIEQQQRQLVNSIALKIRESMDIDDIFNMSVAEVRYLLKTDRVVLFQFDENWVGQIVKESVSPDFPSIIHEVIEDPCFRQEYVNYYRQGRVRAIDDIKQARLQPCHIEMLEKYAVKANLVVPVLHQGNLWGLLIAHHCRSARPWHARELDILNELATHIGIAINQGELYQKLAQANQELRRLSGQDRLTQLANRHRFDEYIMHTWQRLQRTQLPLAAIFCDADNFKAYNDLYGHSQGDECLKQIAQVLQQAAKRSADLAARYGGEEFVLLLPEIGLEGATQVAQEIMAHIHRLKLPHGASAKGIVTVSMGIASLVPQAETSPKTLIDQADSALYQVKQHGRDGIWVYGANAMAARG
jgi:diguanylate cyclase (GGDEF)-like protein